MHTRILLASVVAVGVFASVGTAQPIASDRLEASMIIAGVPETPRTIIPLVEERLNVTIDGQHATSTLLQVYQHDNSGNIEGQYRFRPGLGSKVEGFAYWNGEQKIVGEVFERQTAKRVYQNVTTARRDPALLEEDGEGAFMFKVFPIQPREKKRVELKWTKWLDRHGATVKYRAPITRSDAEIVINLNGPVKNLKSSSHRLRVEKVAGGVRLRSEGANGSGPLELSWDVDEPDWQPDAYVQAGGKNGDGWFALSLAAPDLGNAAVAAKDVTIVIDRSGSMIGEPIENARRAAADMIRRLDPKDRVNVISFSDEVDPLFRAPKELDNGTREQAIGFVGRLQDGGGTDIALALKTAIASQDRKQGRPRVIVFMTDGQSDVDLALEAAKADTGDVRLFTIGLGKEVNKPLLSRLAAIKRGRFTYIESAKDIKPEVGRLAQSIAKPLLVDISVDVEGAQAVRLYPRSMPDLFALDELVVTGRLRGTGTAKFVIKGTLGGKQVTFTKAVDVAHAAFRPWVGRLWAQARVDHLLEEIALGAKQPEYQNEVLDLALAYNFVTPYTAFLAIPESEMGNERNTIEQERERKRKLMESNPDVANLDKKRKQTEDEEFDARPGLGTSAGSPVAVQGSAPTIDPSSTTQGVKMDTARDDDGDEDAEDSRATRKRMASADRAQYAPVSEAGSVRHGRGCAGCATGGDATPALALALVVGLIVLRRRRR